MSEFNEQDSVVVFYFNASSGRPNEKRLRVEEVLSGGYKLSESLSQTEYRFDGSEEKLYIKREDEFELLGNEASISEPR